MHHAALFDFTRLPAGTGEALLHRGGAALRLLRRWLRRACAIGLLPGAVLSDCVCGLCGSLIGGRVSPDFRWWMTWLISSIMAIAVLEAAATNASWVPVPWPVSLLTLSGRRRALPPVLSFHLELRWDSFSALRTLCQASLALPLGCCVLGLELGFLVLANLPRFAAVGVTIALRFQFCS